MNIKCGVRAGLAVVTAILVGLGWSVSVARADLYHLSDANSAAMFDLSGPSAGMGQWCIDGVDQMRRQWLWYRIGQGGAESSIDTLDLDLAGTSDTDFDGYDDVLFLRYIASDFELTITYTLMGGSAGSGAATMGEVISIRNTSADPLDMHLFQYCDFELDGSPHDLGVSVVNANTIVEYSASRMAETVITPAPHHYAAGLAGELLATLTDAAPTTLADAAGPAGPGDLAWAIQWDWTLSPGDSVIVSEEKRFMPTPVPEPATSTILIVALAGLARRRRGRVAI